MVKFAYTYMQHFQIVGAANLVLSFTSGVQYYLWEPLNVDTLIMRLGHLFNQDALISPTP